MELVWSTEIDTGTAYLLHITQVTVFYLGLVLIFFGIRRCAWRLLFHREYQ